MKKTIILITAVLLCAVSCSRKNTPESENIPDSPKSYTAEKLTDIAYKKESVKLPDGMNQIYCFNPYNNSQNYFILGAGVTIPEFWTTSDFQNFEKVEIPDFDIGVSYNIDVSENGTVAEFFVDVDYGDLPDPDPLAPDYNEAKYDAAATYSFKINTYSVDGKLLTSATVGEFPETPDKSCIIEEVVSDSNLLIASINGTYYIFKTDGSYVGEISADDGETIEAIGHDKDGSLVCAVSMDDNKLQIRRISSDGSIEKSSVTYDFGESIQDNIISGTGDYSMFIRSRSTIFGIRSDSSAIEPLFSINYAGLGSDNIRGFRMGDDGRFSVVENKYSDFSVKMRTYTPCSREEYESIPHITVGAKYEDYLLKDYIDNFNDNHDNMQIDMKIYANDYSNDKVNLIGDETFAKDMLAGNIPDVLLMDDTSGNFGSANLYKQGALCDLYSFIDSDEILSRDSFIPNVIESLEIDGGLYVLPNAFSIDLRYTAKEKFVKDIETWDFNTYMDIVENLPDGMGLERWENSTDGVYDTKYRRRSCYNWCNWADFENNTCNFNNDEFIRYLNYCNGADVIDVEPEPFDPNSWTDDDHNYNFKMQQTQYRDELALFNHAYVSSYAGYLDLTEGEFGGEPIITLGEIGNNNTPVTFGTGGINAYSVTTTSDKQDLAWNFVSSMVSDEYYSENTPFGFPITKSGLEIKAEFDKRPQNNEYDEDFKDYTGYLYPYGDGDNYSKLGYVDDKIISEVNKLIEKAVPRKSGVYPGQDFYNIAYEEFDRFFNGQTSAEQCAETMQSRLSLYLAENN